MLPGLASEKETQVKMMDYTINASVYQTYSKEGEESFDLSNSSHIKRIPDTQSNNKGIKSVQLTYKIIDKEPNRIGNTTIDRTRSKNVTVRFTLNLIDSQNRSVRPVKVAITPRAGNAYTIETVRNGQLEKVDSNGNIIIPKELVPYNNDINAFMISDIEVYRSFGAATPITLKDGTVVNGIKITDPNELAKYIFTIGNMRIERY